MPIDLDEYADMTTLSDCQSVLAGVLAHPLAKGLAASGLWACGALGLPVDLALVMVTLFLADFVLGVFVAAKRRRFSCRKFMRGISKVPVYTLLLLVAWLCQYTAKSVLGHDLPVPLWTAAYLAMHDAMSILGKCDALGWPVPAIFKRIVRRVNRAAESAVDSALDKVDPPKRDDGAFSKF